MATSISFYFTNSRNFDELCFAIYRCFESRVHITKKKKIKNDNEQGLTICVIGILKKDALLMCMNMAKNYGNNIAIFSINGQKPVHIDICGYKLWNAYREDIKKEKKEEKQFQFPFPYKRKININSPILMYSFEFHMNRGIEYVSKNILT